MKSGSMGGSGELLSSLSGNARDLEMDTFIQSSSLSVLAHVGAVIHFLGTSPSLGTLSGGSHPSYREALTPATGRLSPLLQRYPLMEAGLGIDIIPQREAPNKKENRVRHSSSCE